MESVKVKGTLPIAVHSNQYILVTSDHFTKWDEAVVMANQYADMLQKASLRNSWPIRAETLFFDLWE